MPFFIVEKDITQMKVDAIVNAANSALRMGGGVCGAIFEAAGPEELQAACDPLAPIETGQAVITPGFNLPSKHVIHAVGPRYDSKHPTESESLLTAAYTNALKLAVENKLESIAFPLISSGIYGYPKEDALNVAKSAIKRFLVEHELDVYLVIYNKSGFTLPMGIQRNINANLNHPFPKDPSYKHLFTNTVQLIRDSAPLARERIHPTPVPAKRETKSDLSDIIGNLDEPFSTALLRLIDARNLTDVEVYKRANLNRKLFSKIRTVKNYLPSKRTAIALAIALELNLDETASLLKKAGYALSPSQKFDTIIEYFILNRQYNIHDINDVLFFYDQALLGS